MINRIGDIAKITKSAICASVCILHIIVIDLLLIYISLFFQVSVWILYEVPMEKFLFLVPVLIPTGDSNVVGSSELEGKMSSF